MSTPGSARRFDDFGFRAGSTARSRHSVQWPIARAAIQRLGQSVLEDRNGKGRPHRGLDLFADAGTPVVAACSGVILRVIDGRSSTQRGLRRAGLFVDQRGEDQRIYRYLHLMDAGVQAGAWVARGAQIGHIAAPFTSGLREAPHLHFEVRLSDYAATQRDYGAPVDPLTVLPPWQV